MYIYSSIYIYIYIYIYICMYRGPPTSRRRHQDEWRPYQKPQTSGCATSARGKQASPSYLKLGHNPATKLVAH